MIAGPAAPWIGRFLVVRGGAFLARKGLTTYGKKTSQKRMQAEAAKRGGIALSPAPQGPYGMVQGFDPFSQSGGDQGSSLPSIPGVVKPGSIGSPLTQATRAPSRGRRGSRTSGRRRRAPYCRSHKKRHWCTYTR